MLSHPACIRRRLPQHSMSRKHRFELSGNPSLHPTTSGRPTAKSVLSRYFALLSARLDLYNTAFDVPKVSRGTTWVGHQQQYREAQRVLQKAIDALLAAGCTPSPDQLKWAR